MFCENCGTKFNGKFCPNCGTASIEQQKVVIMQSIHDEDPKMTSDFFQSIRALEKMYGQIEPLIHEYEELEIARFTKSMEMNQDIEEARTDSLSTMVVKGYVAVCTLGLSSKLGKKSDKARKEKAVEEVIAHYSPIIHSIEIQMEKIAAKVQSFSETEEWRLAELVVPDEIFIDIDAVRTISKYCSMGRVTTKKDAINLYTEESYKQRMETIALEHLSLADQELQVQREMCGLINNIREEMLSMSEYFAKQTKLMTEIRRNSRQSVSAARFTAMCQGLQLFTTKKVKVTF